MKPENRKQEKEKGNRIKGKTEKNRKKSHTKLSPLCSPGPI